jgi:hypothetical protein
VHPARAQPRLRDSTSPFSTVAAALAEGGVGQVDNLARKDAVKLFPERTALLRVRTLLRVKLSGGRGGPG